jgi:chromosome segregation ATPase
MHGTLYFGSIKISHFHKDNVGPKKSDMDYIGRIHKLTRKLCFDLHTAHTRLLNLKRKGVSSYNEEVSSYNEGVSSYNEEVSSYNEEVSSYNEGVSSYNEGVSSYNEEVSSYNEEVSSYNGMRQSQRTSWSYQVVIRSRL